MKYKLLVAEIIILLLWAVIFESIDFYFSGDEVVTYSMANNDKAGFVFSDGRVSNYLKNEVFTDDSNIVSKLAEVASDLVKKRGAASILTYPRESEVKLYTRDEVNDWFSKRSDERFNVASTWLHSVSDDGNSWLYYSLVNVSSSIFPGLSATKWTGFFVNLLFHALTLILLFHLGKRLGNTAYQNIALLLFFGCSADILTTTVTNLRAYTVASFFTTLLVWNVLNIHDSIMNDNKVQLKDAILVVVTYVIGYVSHYTIGAVLASFGAILLLFIIRSKSRGTGNIILTGIIALCGGFMFSPDSIVGILKKFMANGAGAAISGEGSGFSGGIVLMTIESFVLLAVCIIAVLRNEELVRNRLVFITCSALLMLFIILLGTKGFGYTRVLFPVMYLTAFRWIAVGIERISDKIEKKTVQIVTLVALVVYILANMIIGYNFKMTENREFLAKEAALDTIDTTTCVYFRKHAQGYADTRCLMDRFKKVQVITLDTEDWDKLVEYKPSGEAFICFFSDDCEDESALKWIDSLGYSSKQELYSDEATHIFVAGHNE